MRVNVIFDRRVGTPVISALRSPRQEDREIHGITLS